VKRSYIGFKADISKKLMHIEGDFEINEILMELDESTKSMLVKSLGSREFTLEDIKKKDENLSEALRRVYDIAKARKVGDMDVLLIVDKI